ncbi:glutathione S-transferase [Saccharibacter sp. 17.LH.SD]|nr:glutathione S-transferase [Saccharibacter sp. 17.LH.SD]
MKLYYAPGTCALACWIALEWAGLEHEVEKVDPHAESYLKINPLGLVPALDIGAQRPYTQADAILQYVAHLAPAAKLGAVSDKEGVLEFTETMSFLTGDFHPAFWPYFAPQRFTTETSSSGISAVKESAYARVARVLEHLNNLIETSGGLHVYRGRRSVADAYAYIMTRWSTPMPGTASWKNYKTLSQFMDTMSKDSSVHKVLKASNNNQ